MVYGHYPFIAENLDCLKLKILKNDALDSSETKLTKKWGNSFSSNKNKILKILSLTLKKDQKLRPSIQEVISLINEERIQTYKNNIKQKSENYIRIFKQGTSITGDGSKLKNAIKNSDIDNKENKNSKLVAQMNKKIDKIKTNSKKVEKSRVNMMKNKLENIESWDDISKRMIDDFETKFEVEKIESLYENISNTSLDPQNKFFSTKNYNKLESWDYNRENIIKNKLINLVGNETFVLVNDLYEELTLQTTKSNDAELFQPFVENYVEFNKLCSFFELFYELKYIEFNKNENL